MMIQSNNTMRYTRKFAAALGLAALLGSLWLAAPTLAQALPDMGDTTAQPYVLSPDDQLDIFVLGHEEFKGSATILPDGTFTYPAAGTIHAAGLTVEGLRQTLTRKLSRLLNHPQVTVSVKEGRPRQVSVLGAVRSPGQYPFKSGMHLLDLIAMSGGPVPVVRPVPANASTGEGTTTAAAPLPSNSPTNETQTNELTTGTLVVDGGKKSIPVDFVKLLGGTDGSQNLPLEPGDVLLVQQKEAPMTPVYRVQAMGEVARPGEFVIPGDGISVVSLLTQAGGATPKAALTRAQILHGGQVQVLNLRPLMSDLSSAAGRVRLLPGDVLLVPENAAKIAVLGEVRQPAAYDIPDGESLSTTSALVLAGGATNNADRKNANILRRSPDGQPVLMAVDLDALMQGRGGRRDAMLQPGDILYVPPAKQKSPGFNPLSLLNFLPFVSILRH